MTYYHTKFEADFEADLLPASSTKLERVLEKALRLPPEVWQTAGRVGDVKTDLPDEAVPFMIWELGLEPVMPYISEPRRALKDGREWQRVRGTPASIAIALNWIGKKAFVEEDAEGSWWDLFQLGLDEIPTTQKQIADIIGLTKLSKTAHTDLIRIYSGYDLRALKLDEGTLDGPWLVDDWSGVWEQPRSNSVSGSAKESGWPKLSFGRDNIGVSKLGSISFSSLLETTGFSRRSVGFAVNQHRIDGPRFLEPPFALGTTGGLETISRSRFDKRPTGWPLGVWQPEVHGSLSFNAIGTPVKTYVQYGTEAIRLDGDRLNGPQLITGVFHLESPSACRDFRINQDRIDSCPGIEAEKDPDWRSNTNFVQNRIGTLKLGSKTKTRHSYLETLSVSQCKGGFTVNEHHIDGAQKAQKNFSHGTLWSSLAVYRSELSCRPTGWPLGTWQPEVHGKPNFRAAGIRVETVVDYDPQALRLDSGVLDGPQLLTGVISCSVPELFIDDEAFLPTAMPWIGPGLRVDEDRIDGARKLGVPEAGMKLAASDFGLDESRIDGVNKVG